MRLYHFTSFYNMEKVGPGNIMTAGLKAMPQNDGWLPWAGVADCVWLTADPDMSPRHSSYYQIRVKLIIPKTDTRLVHVPKLRRKLGLDQDVLDRNYYKSQTELLHSWYIYKGDIPLKLGYIREVEYADAAKREPARQEGVSEDRSPTYAFGGRRTRAM